jgi:UDPglucose--hexose-1-phosphate uridylyltransferase
MTTATAADQPADDACRVQVDPTTGRPILLAPHRVHRPYLFGRDGERQPCPFCPGNEHHTPPEVDAERPGGGAPDQPGWVIRAVPNRYPATAHHEVIAEGATHAVQPAALDVAVWQHAVAVYRRRIRHIEAQAGVRCAYLFKNVGQRAGASIAHNHTQVLGLPLLPPRLELELSQARGRSCAHCEEIETAGADGRIIHRGQHHVVLAPRASKLPFETWLLPLDHDADFLDGAHTDDLAQTLHATFVRLVRAFGDPSFNLFLHRIPRERFHWHVELQPRTGNLAGLELGGDMYINAVPAAASAARLRGEQA